MIRDRTRTPFNIGTPIKLDGLNRENAQLLAEGLTIQEGSKQLVLKEILDWTQGQPFLTQKLCQLAISSSQSAITGELTIPPGSEAYWVEQLVMDCIIKEWESQDEPEHLRTIRNRILNNPENVGRLLGLYQQILNEDDPVAVDNSREQIELVLAGLVVQQGGCLRVKNPIYTRVFNRSWVDQQLSTLRPYAQGLEMWLASGQADESRLLRGQALRDAQAWSRGKRLGDEDYQFLAASVESDRKAVRQAAEAERIQLKLEQEQQTSRLQRRFLGAVSAALLMALGFGAITFGLYRRTQISEIEAIATAAEGRFESHHQLDAFQQIITAKTKLKQLYAPPAALTQQVRRVLQRSLDGANALNQLNFDSEISAMDLHPNGELLAVITSSGTLSFWHPSGTPTSLHLSSMGKTNPEAQPFSQAKFSPNGQQLATVSSDNIQLWEREDDSLRLIHQFDSPAPQIQQISFMPDGRALLLSSSTGLQQLDIASNTVTKLPAEHPINQSAISPKGRWIAATYRLKVPTKKSVSGGGLRPRALGFENDRASDVEVFGRPPGEPFPSPSGRGPKRPTGARPSQKSSLAPGRGAPLNIGIWDSSGTPINTFSTGGGPIFALAIHPVRDLIATAHVDGQILLSQPDGERVQELYGSRSKVRKLAFSPDRNLLAVGDDDGGIHLWNVGGSLIKSLFGHRGSISQLQFGPNGTWLVSASKDSTVRFWSTDHPQQRILAGHTDMITSLFYSPDGNLLYSLGVDQRMAIWQRDSDNQWQTIPKQSEMVHVMRHGSSVSADRRLLAQISKDGQPMMMRLAIEATDAIDHASTTSSGSIGSELAELEGIDRASAIAIAPSGQHLAVGDRQGHIHLFEAAADRETAFAPAPQQTLNGTGKITALAWSPDERWIVAGYDSGSVLIWRDGVAFPLQASEVSDGAHRAAISTIAISPDGRWIASGSKDKTIKIWTQDGALSHTLVGHEADVQVLTFHPDSTRLASASVDSTVNLWKISEQVPAPRALLRSLTGHIGQINAVSFSPDGNELATAGTDRRIIVWKIDDILQRDELSDACDQVRDYLNHSPMVEEGDRKLCD